MSGASDFCIVKSWFLGQAGFTALAAKTGRLVAATG
jgi:hypothetical protein